MSVAEKFLYFNIFAEKERRKKKSERTLQMLTKSLTGDTVVLIAVSLVALAGQSCVPAHTRFELLSAVLGRNKDAVQYVYACRPVWH